MSNDKMREFSNAQKEYFILSVITETIVFGLLLTSLWVLV